ncbi:hypothetical protein E2562_039079 [Oryza meyeriana var. granulata]|uniref:Uncharacterized protein n=1 Tax=Oryza meyeriana var. granulata TaxID=110450 RepID=A0A6G1E8V2_9ORYZ|nr:hypothetical protein E2562_039079 [Oryza meyeriana var. granulata]
MKNVNPKIDEKYMEYKQFDTVGDHNDHFYSKPGERNVQEVKKFRVNDALLLAKEIHLENVDNIGST